MLPAMPPARPLALTLLLTLALPVGCTTSAYVNIPAEPGDTLATHDPNSNAVRDVATVALAAAVRDVGITGPVEIALPKGSIPLTYADVAGGLERLGVMVRAEGDEADAPLFEVHSVHLRGGSAEVGVVRPWLGSRQLVSVFLKQKGMGGPWTVSRTRAWLGPVQITPGKVEGDPRRSAEGTGR